MAAIVALLTAFGIVFGVLKYWQTPPVVYLFVASEIVAICLAQILFGSAPRIGSITTGAVLLPFWVSLTVEDRLVNLMSPEVFWISLVSLVAFGGLLGYCIGALAAGFFLVMDMLEGALPSHTSSAPQPKTRWGTDWTVRPARRGFGGKPAGPGRSAGAGVAKRGRSRYSSPSSPAATEHGCP